MEKKIFITGTGRCGTTFLMRLFTLLGYKTGFSPGELKDYAGPKGPGLEYCPEPSAHHAPVFKQFEVFKSPWYVYCVTQIITELGRELAPKPSVHTGPAQWPLPSSWIETFIVPLRDFHDTAESAFKRSLTSPYGGPGLIRWPAKQPIPSTIEEQVKVYEEAIRELQQGLAIFEAPVVYLDFKSMTSSPVYLYERLKHVLEKKNISPAAFTQAYEEATNLWTKGAF